MSSYPDFPALPAPAVTDRPAAASASVTASDGAVIATVTRRIVPAGPADPSAEVVVSVQGDLDLDTAPLAQAVLTQALDGAERVRLDLSDVRFFGAAGVGVVVAGRQHAASLGRELRLSGVHGITERVLALTGVCPRD
jgi:anti-sigma B factor antagonist